jgi:hypothetical protein
MNSKGQKNRGYNRTTKREAIAMCNLWNPENQIKIKFTWTSKIIISFKQLMKQALYYSKTSRKYYPDEDTYRTPTLKENISFLFRQYKNWKRVFCKSGNTETMPDFVYFQD